MSKIHILFDGPPSHVSGRFIEVENDAGKSINVGEWKERPDGLWELIIELELSAQSSREKALAEALRLVIPLAKGYSAEHRVGSNQVYIEQAEATLEPYKEDV